MSEQWKEQLQELKEQRKKEHNRHYWGMRMKDKSKNRKEAK